MKQVTQLNDDGFVVGRTFADESPLEPGVFLIPRGCVEALVEVPEGKRAFWNGKAFEISDIPQPEPKPEPLPEPATWASVRAKRNALLAACDWTQLGDIPAETRALWVYYRRLLRNLPQSFDAPEKVVWPEQP